MDRLQERSAPADGRPPNRSVRNPYETTMALHPGSLGVVAEDPRAGVVGMGFVRLGSGRFQGRVRPLGRLFGIVVDPEHRRRGLATALSFKLLEAARKVAGPEALFVAALDPLNEASVKAASTWVTQLIEGRVRTLVVARPVRAPASPKDGTIRPAEDDDWEACAEGANRFHADAELAPVVTAEALRAFHTRAPWGVPLQAYWVAVARDQRPLAGLSVVFEGAVDVRDRPVGWWTRLQNPVWRSAGLVPLAVRDLWYRPGAEAWVVPLWKTAAWNLRDQGNAFTATVDPRSPLATVVPSSAFPGEETLLALAADQQLDRSRFFFLPF